VHPTLRQAQGPLVGLLLRSVRVFKQFAWLKVGSVKAALSQPTHQRVTPVVGLFLCIR